MKEALPNDLLERVLARLGVERPSAQSRVGLDAVYAAWCEGVPFDNLHKRRHLHAADTGILPGDDADDFFEKWLETGAGGTCWAGNNALYTLVASLGFEASRAVGAMLPFPMEDPEPGHGTVVVALDGDRLMLDASMLHGSPLPLIDGESTRLDGPGWGIRSRCEDGTFYVTWHPGGGEPFDCKLLRFESDREEFRTRHERSRTWSPFNQQLSFRVARGNRLIGIGMGGAFVIESDGTSRIEPLDDAGRRRFLVEEGRIEEGFVASLPDDEPPPSPASD